MRWERKDNFKINEKMKEVLRLTIEASRAQQAVYRRQLEKLTYGS